MGVTIACTFFLFSGQIIIMYLGVLHMTFKCALFLLQIALLLEREGVF